MFPLSAIVGVVVFEVNAEAPEPVANNAEPASNCLIVFLLDESVAMIDLSQDNKYKN